jgi:hypothetical protein
MQELLIKLEEIFAGLLGGAVLAHIVSRLSNTANTGSE